MSLQMLRAAVLILTFVASAFPAFGQSPTDKIDSDLKKCLAQRTNFTTAGMQNCVGTAYQQMDSRLNEVYLLLMAKLTPQKRELLKDAQRKWLAFRDAELRLSKSLDPYVGGTISPVTSSSDSYEILKKRTKELEKHLRQVE